MTAARPGYPTDHEPTIAIHPAYGRFEDVAAVVGTQRPDAGGCWCMAYRDSSVANKDRPAYMAAECAAEPGPGVLVYVDDVVAGWCSIAPRARYRRLLHSRTIPILDDRDAWVAVCFVVRAGYRKHGLMHRLLSGAVDHAAAHRRSRRGLSGGDGWWPGRRDLRVCRHRRTVRERGIRARRADHRPQRRSAAMGHAQVADLIPVGRPAVGGSSYWWEGQLTATTRRC